MKRAIQNLFRTSAPEYISRHREQLTEQQRKAMAAIRKCGTADAGSLLFSCDDCGQPHVVERSCGNRICPSCQTGKTGQWLDKRLARQLPIHYFMLTFTVPEQLRPFMLHRPRVAYDALFAAASTAIRTLAAHPRHIGADLPGFFGVLHTWGGTLQFHPHIHFVVPGGGIDRESGLWRSSRADFYAPVHALSKEFRAEFRKLMDRQDVTDEIDPRVWDISWNVNSQAVHSNRKGMLKYLATYVYRTAITDSRIISVNDRTVTFTYRKKGSGRLRRMTLSTDEFIRRFLMHVLPPGFMRIRYYGFMSAGAGVPHERLVALVEMAQGFDVEALHHQPAEPTPMLCPLCGGHLSFDRILAQGNRILEGVRYDALHRLE